MYSRAGVPVRKSLHVAVKGKAVLQLKVQDVGDARDMRHLTRNAANRE